MIVSDQGNDLALFLENSDSATASWTRSADSLEILLGVQSSNFASSDAAAGEDVGDAPFPALMVVSVSETATMKTVVLSGTIKATRVRGRLWTLEVLKTGSHTK